MDAIIKLFPELIKKNKKKPRGTLDYVKPSYSANGPVNFYAPLAATSSAMRHVICMIRCISDWLMNRSEHSLASSLGRPRFRKLRARPTTHLNLIVHSIIRVVRVEGSLLCRNVRDTTREGKILRGRYKFRSGRFRNKHKAAVCTKVIG